MASSPCQPESCPGRLRPAREVRATGLADPGISPIGGLGNEVGIYLFCYDPALELELRRHRRPPARDSENGALPCRLIERNLRPAARHPRRASGERAIPLRSAAGAPPPWSSSCARRPRWTPCRSLDYGPHEPGDVVLITGVGEVCIRTCVPTRRSTTSSTCSLTCRWWWPIRVSADGQSMRLFAGASGHGLEDGNYYRAFNLV